MQWFYIYVFTISLLLSGTSFPLLNFRKQSHKLLTVSSSKFIYAFPQIFSSPYANILAPTIIVKKRCLQEWTLFSTFLNPLNNLSIWFHILPVRKTLLRCKYCFSSYLMQSLPVLIIRCEENEIYQLDFRIQTDNIRCFILLSGLRKVNIIPNINPI